MKAQKRRRGQSPAKLCRYSTKGCSAFTGFNAGRDLRGSFGPSPHFMGSQVTLVVKNPPANAGDIRDVGLIPGLERSPGERRGNPLQYSCPENLMNRGAWRATVHGVKKSQTQLKQLSMQKCCGHSWDRCSEALRKIFSFSAVGF